MNKKERRKFYNNLENSIRERSIKWNDYFITVHFKDFTIDFIREFRNDIDFKEVYERFVIVGRVWELKEDEKTWKEFFGDKDKWDI